MKSNCLSYKRLLIAFTPAIVALVMIALQLGSTLAQAADIKQSGTLTINQAQVAFIFSGNLGGGKLTYGDKTYDFTVGGLGVGGFGVSSIEATGEVYNLADLSDFEGAYGQARTGIAVGTVGGGNLWLENPAGVYIHLAAKRKGLALSIGADAVYIKLN